MIYFTVEAGHDPITSMVRRSSALFQSADRFNVENCESTQMIVVDPGEQFNASDLDAGRGISTLLQSRILLSSDYMKERKAMDTC